VEVKAVTWLSNDFVGPCGRLTIIFFFSGSLYLASTLSYSPFLPICLTPIFTADRKEHTVEDHRYIHGFSDKKHEDELFLD
jgi:hypothetical protein